MTQSEALRLADEMERVAEYDHQVQAAAELRRLYEVNQELLTALKQAVKLNGFREFNDHIPAMKVAIAKAEGK